MITRAFLFLLAVIWTVPAAARLKIDRYEPTTLPKVRLWVTWLNETRPQDPNLVQAFSIYTDGKLTSGDELDWQTAAERAEPMALAVVADARYGELWRATQRGMEKLFETLPPDSEVFTLVHHDGRARLPEQGFLQDPKKLLVSLREIEAGGEAPWLYEGALLALQAFPLREGVEPEETDGPQPPPRGKKEPPFPTDRVLVLIGDGVFEPDPEKGEVERLRLLVDTARRRGVRIMTVGLDDGSEDSHLWSLQALARKSSGTYRLAADTNGVADSLAEVGAELAGRFILEAEAEGLRRGDQVFFSVRAHLKMGNGETSREFGARIENQLGFFARIFDAISDFWEGLALWIKLVALAVVALVVTAIVVITLWRKRKKRRAAQEAAEKARLALLAKRKPCSVCGQMMMPEWKTCMFCERAAATQKPMRFRLTGRVGMYEGQALRFDQSVITLGAAPGCEIQIPERGVAAKHCGLRERGPGEFVLTDFNTDAGTFVNGNRVTQVVLAEGDLIKLGQTELVFGIEA